MLQGEVRVPESEFLGKKQNFLPDIPKWELKTDFDPLSVNRRVCGNFVNYRGVISQPSTPLTAENVVNEFVDFDLADLRFRDPDNFLAGNLHDHCQEWETLSPSSEVMNWIKYGVDVHKFFKPYKGNFKGRHLDSALPPCMYFPNAKVCEQFGDFIARTLEERIRNESLTVLGKVGECDPPYLILPLTVEPTKPRLCHNDRFINLWIVDSPFSLETSKEIHRLVNSGDMMSCLDDKSGYDHILLHENSRKYFGIQFGGFYLVFNTIPFGFKTSACWFSGY